MCPTGHFVVFFKKIDLCIGFIFYTQVYNHKIGQVRFRVKSANYYESYGPFLTSFVAKCLHVGEDGPGQGHLCHTDTFLVQFSGCMNRGPGVSNVHTTKIL